MEKLKTPFGEIEILIDGKPFSYSVQEGGKLDVLCPHILGRYQITIHFVPDGKEHIIACVFDANCKYKRTPESGERLECQSFYNDCRYKMSIGVECEAEYTGGARISDEYDYDAEYLKNGMSYIVLPDTKTEQYVFALAGIDGVGWDDPIADNKRDVETWFGADPTVSL